ncbi:MAG: hypothetical protein ABJD11_02830 [Gemmatimonadota bacterium]
MTTSVSRTSDAVETQVALAFAPLHKRAFGIAIGLATGLVIFFATIIYLLRGPFRGENLWLLRSYFYGYSVSWEGAFVGLAWGCFVGFVAGWFIAFCRNFVIAVSVFIIRTKAELSQQRDFLDHI